MQGTEIKAGIKIHGYSLIEFISRGATAEVWRIRDESGIDKALKIFAPAQQMNAATLDMLIDEFKLLYRLDHPHVLKSEIMGAYQKVPYIIMPYYSDNLAADMNKRMRQVNTNIATGLFSETECIEVMRQIGAGLSYLHDQRIIHQDVKPENILFNPASSKRSYVLTDFGISTRIKENMARMTMPHHQGYALTPAYAAPEQYLGKPQFKSDVFSLGVLLFEMSEGRLPFSRQGYISDSSGALLRPSFENAELSEGFKTIILRALAEQPEDRPVAIEFEGYGASAPRPYRYTEVQPSSIPPEPASSSASLPRPFYSPPLERGVRRTSRLPLFGAVLLAFAATAGFLLLKKGQARVRQGDLLFTQGMMVEASQHYSSMFIPPGNKEAEAGRLRTGRILAREYDEILPFRSDRAPVKRNGKWGFIDPEGREVIPCKYLWVSEFNTTTAAVCLKDQECGIIDLNGIQKCPMIYSGYQILEANKWSLIHVMNGQRKTQTMQF